MVALRLLHVTLPRPPPSADTLFSTPSSTKVQSPTLARWKLMFSGFQNIVDEENEKLARQTLYELCMALKLRSITGLRRLAGSCPTIGSEIDKSNCYGKSWMPYALSCMRVLWEEERDLAQAVLDCIENDVEF